MNNSETGFKEIEFNDKLKFKESGYEIFKKTKDKEKNANNFFVFGKTSKQTFLRKNEKSPPKKLKEKEKDFQVFETKLPFDDDSHNNKKELSKTKIRPKSQMSRTTRNFKITKDLKIIENKNKQEEPKKINDFLNIEFTEQEKVEYSEIPKKNKKLKETLEKNKNLLKKNFNSATNTNNVFKIDNNFNPDNAEYDEDFEFSPKGEEEEENNFDFSKDIKEDEFETNKPNTNNSSVNDIVGTIKMISTNPERFKKTNNLLKVLGRFTAKNINIIYNEEADKEKMENVLKEFEEEALKRTNASEKIKDSNVNLKEHSEEINRLRDDFTKNKEKKQKEAKDKVKGIIDVTKDPNRETTFDINNIKEHDRKILTNKINYVYRHQREKQKDRPITSSNDKIYQMSTQTINKSVSAREVLENVMNNIENNFDFIYSALENQQKMNGFKLKAYENLLNKGKTINEHKILKESKKSKISKEDLYNKVYFNSSTTINKSNLVF